MQNYYANSDSAGAGGAFRLMRNSTAIFEPTGTNNVWLNVTSVSTPRLGGYVNFSYLDSPSSTSSLTYKVQARLQVTTNNNNIAANHTATSTIIVMEIGA